MTEEREEEAWTEEYFKKQDCGYVEGEPPTYQWVMYSIDDEYPEIVGTFCKEGYAKLYEKWMESLHPTTAYYIDKVINNPQKPKELQTK